MINKNLKNFNLSYIIKKNEKYGKVSSIEYEWVIKNAADLGHLGEKYTTEASYTFACFAPVPHDVKSRASDETKELHRLIHFNLGALTE